jgi:hypothetical protein
MKSIFAMLLLCCCCPLAFADGITIGPNVSISAKVSITGTSPTQAVMSANTAASLGSLSILAQTPFGSFTDSKFCPDIAQLPFNTFCPFNLTQNWCSAAFDEATSSVVMKGCGGHDDYYGDEGYQQTISNNGTAYIGTFSRLQISGTNDPPAPNGPGGISVCRGALTLALPYQGTQSQCNAGNVMPCVDDGTHLNCYRPAFHQYGGFAYDRFKRKLYFFGGFVAYPVGTSSADAWMYSLDPADADYGKWRWLSSYWTQSGGTVVGSSDNVCDFDESRRTFWCANTQGGNIVMFEHDVDNVLGGGANKIYQRASFSAPITTGQMGKIDQVNHKFILTFPSSPRKIWTVSTVSSFTTADVTSSFSSCSLYTTADSSTFNFGYLGMTWNRTSSTVDAYPGGGNTVWQIKSDGTCGGIVTTGYTVPTYADLTHGTFGRFTYDPVHDVDVYIPPDVNAPGVSFCVNPLGCRDNPNNFGSRVNGINVPGGRNSIIVANDPATGVLPESFDSAIRHATGGDNTGRGICPNGGVCAGTFKDSLDCAFSADGCSLKLTLSSGGAPDAGDFHTNFSVGSSYGMQFDDQAGNNEFFVQMSVALGTGMLTPSNWPGSGGFKMFIFSEGDRSGYGAPSCSLQPSEIVLVQFIEAVNPAIPTLYTGCGDNDHPYLGLGAGWNSEFLAQPPLGCAFYGGNGIPTDETRCWQFHENEWMTFQMHGKVGSWGGFDSILELWACHQNQPCVLVQNAVDWKLRNTNAPTSKYGKIWPSPYMTGVTSAVVTSFMSFDNLIISKRRLPDPGVRTPNAPDSLTTAIIDTTHVTVSWRVNSQNGTALDDTAFLVERCAGLRNDCLANQNFTQIATTAAGASSYADSGLTHGTTYTYRVRAKNAYGNSGYAMSLKLNTSTNPAGGTATP